jgi:hypothetical protein
VIDSLPLPVIGFHLVPGATSAGYWRAYGAAYGKVVTKKQTIFGYKLHLLVTLNGVIRDFVLAPASINDHRVAPDMLAPLHDCLVLGDKGYIDAALVEALRAEQGVTLATPLRRNQRVQRDPAFVRLLNGFRQVIETVNDQLAAQFNIGRNHAHTFAGLCARLASKLTAHMLCIYINRLDGEGGCLADQSPCLPQLAPDPIGDAVNERRFFDVFAMPGERSTCMVEVPCPHCCRLNFVPVTIKRGMPAGPGGRMWCEHCKQRAEIFTLDANRGHIQLVSRRHGCTVSVTMADAVKTYRDDRKKSIDLQKERAKQGAASEAATEQTNEAPIPMRRRTAT